jgi:hypothetical protein
MILLDAFNWLAAAILWLLTPIFRMVGLYSLLITGVVVLLFATWVALRRARGRTRRVDTVPSEGSSDGSTKRPNPR